MNVFILQQAAAKASALTSRCSLPSSSKAFITQRQMLRKQFLSTDRKQGYEALSELEPKKKMANYATAAACAAFVTGVWYYSVSAVGRGDGELEELEKAAAQKITGGREMLHSKRSGRSCTLTRTVARPTTPTRPFCLPLSFRNPSRHRG